MSTLALVAILCWILGGWVLTRDANLSGAGAAFAKGVVGAFLVSLAFWLTLAWAYLEAGR